MVRGDGVLVFLVHVDVYEDSSWKLTMCHSNTVIWEVNTFKLDSTLLSHRLIYYFYQNIFMEPKGKEKYVDCGSPVSPEVGERALVGQKDKFDAI